MSSSEDKPLGPISGAIVTILMVIVLLVVLYIGWHVIGFATVLIKWILRIALVIFVFGGALYLRNKAKKSA